MIKITRLSNPNIFISVDFLQKFWYNKSIKQLNNKQDKDGRLCPR